jgi:hypothetical protein
MQIVQTLRRSHLAACLPAFCAAILLPLPFLGATPFAYVELLTLDSLGLSVAGLIQHRLDGAHTPTWYLLLRQLGLAGGQPWELRLPSTLAHGAAAVLAALIGRRLAGGRGLLLAGLLVALHPMLLEFSNYARPYAPLIAATLWLLLSAAALADRPRLAVAALGRGQPPGRPRRRLRWLWASASLAPLLAASLLPLGILAWAVLDLALAGWLWFRRGQGRAARRRLLGRLLLLRLLPILLTLLGYLALYGAFSRMAGNYWPREFALKNVLQTLETALGWVPMVDRDAFLPGLGNWILGLGMGALALLGFSTARRRALRVMTAALAVGLPVLLLAMSLHTSLLVPRYFGPAGAGLALLAAAGAAWLAGRLRPGGRVIFLVALLSLAGSQALDAITGDRGRPRIETLADWMAAADSRPGEEALMTNFQATSFAINHYLATWGSPRVAVDVDYPTARVLLDKGRRVWVVSVYDRNIPQWVETLAQGRPVITCERRIEALVIVIVVSLDPAALPPLCRDP